MATSCVCVTAGRTCSILFRAEERAALIIIFQLLLFCGRRGQGVAASGLLWRSNSKGKKKPPPAAAPGPAMLTSLKLWGCRHNLVVLLVKSYAQSCIRVSGIPLFHRVCRHFFFFFSVKHGAQLYLHVTFLCLKLHQKHWISLHVRCFFSVLSSPSRQLFSL